MNASKIIKINKKLLAFRDDAQAIRQECERTTAHQIELDFAAVEFMSRSFADELLAVIADLDQRGKRVRPILLQPNPKKLLNLVKSARSTIRQQLARV